MRVNDDIDYMRVSKKEKEKYRKGVSFVLAMAGEIDCLETLLGNSVQTTAQLNKIIDQCKAENVQIRKDF